MKTTLNGQYTIPSREDPIEPLKGENAQDFLDIQATANRLWKIGDVAGRNGSLYYAMYDECYGDYAWQTPIEKVLRFIMNEPRLAPILIHKVQQCLAAFAGVDVSGFNLYHGDILFILNHFLTWRDYEIPKPTEQPTNTNT